MKSEPALASDTFQSFAAPSATGRAATAARLDDLRTAMQARGLDALLVPRTDEHQGEYVPACAERLAWLTGFTGSAGMAIIGRTTAVLLVDGRYTLQAADQVDTSVIAPRQTPEATAAKWLSETLSAGAVVGFDVRLHTVGEIERLAAALAPKKIRLKGLATNLVDRQWAAQGTRPPPPSGPVVLQPEALAGRSARDKIAAIQKELRAEGQCGVVLTLTDSIAWAFNIRGSDVAHNPVVLAFALVSAEGKAELFVEPDRLAPDVRRALAGAAIVHPPRALWDRIAALLAVSDRPLRLDPETVAIAFARKIGSKRIARAADPCIKPKSIKTEAEIAGARAAHQRDGAAVCRFLAWLDGQVDNGGLDEITAVRMLERFRRETGALAEISFDTISGSGPNGAIVHYRVTEATNRRLRKGELFLIDSGGQYRDGTTDITRTVAIGKPSAEMRDRFTRVLQGHIAIATARFPKGTRGIDLDPFARRALWAAGLDYDHGTGHGVGSYLAVHEGPQSISKRGMAVLEPGMIVSNEPGYYKTGAYGIRIENLVLVTPVTKPDGGDRETMSFETLTLAPFDRRLIDQRLLSASEIGWIDAYHTRVRKEIGPALDREARAWLIAATAPLGA